MCVFSNATRSAFKGIFGVNSPFKTIYAHIELSVLFLKERSKGLIPGGECVLRLCLEEDLWSCERMDEFTAQADVPGGIQGQAFKMV